MEANSLRLLLVLVGVVVMLAIYFYDAYKKKALQKENEWDELAAAEKIQPVMADDAPIATDEIQKEDELSVSEVPVDEFEDAVTQGDEPEEIPTAAQALVVQLSVIPKAGNIMGGTALLTSFTDLNLEFGDMGVFHCYERHDGVEVQNFHVANIVEPGTFPVGSMSDFESTGIVLFFQANGSINASAAFESMLSAARVLSQSFDADIMDESRQALSLDKIESIQSQLLEFDSL